MQPSGKKGRVEGEVCVESLWNVTLILHASLWTHLGGEGELRERYEARRRRARAKGKMRGERKGETARGKSTLYYSANMYYKTKPVYCANIYTREPLGSH